MKLNNDIQKELREIAPTLSSLEKKNVDEVPSNYFVSFSNEVLKKLRAEELTEIAPALSELEKINLLEVPANYFSAFPAQMQKKISAQQKPKEHSTIEIALESVNGLLEKIAAFIFKPKYAMAYAGITSVIIISALMFTKIQQCNDLDCRLASLSDQEINSYLSSSSDLSSDEIFESADDNTADVQAYKDALNVESADQLKKDILN